MYAVTERPAARAWRDNRSSSRAMPSAFVAGSCRQNSTSLAIVPTHATNTRPTQIHTKQANQSNAYRASIGRHKLLLKGTLALPRQLLSARSLAPPGAGLFSKRTMAINYRSHFAYRIDAWDADGENVIEHLAGVEDLQVAMATYLAACQRWPETPITLRQGTRNHEHARVRRFSWRPVPKTPREGLGHKRGARDRRKRCPSGPNLPLPPASPPRRLGSSS
jgi:hypothetical protein